MNSETRGRRAGGKMVHLDPETMERVEEYRAEFEAEHPGIDVNTGGAMANLIHRGLDVRRGVFSRLVHPADAAIPYSVAILTPEEVHQDELSREELGADA